MKITKLGHCCLLIETKGKRILTDPGSFSSSQNTLKDLDVIVITHEHADHFHLESLKRIIVGNPQVSIVTNSAVGALLAKERIDSVLLEGTSSITLSEIVFEALDSRHEEIYEEIGQVQNTGYFIDGRLFYPGDSFGDPKKAVEILALPVAGPWCKIADAIRYGLRIKPAKAFPVHDGMIQGDKLGSSHGIAGMILGQNGVEFTALQPNESVEF